MTTNAPTSQTDDWWDRLYAEAESVAAEPVARRRVIGGGGGRLPDWWAPKPEDLLAAGVVEDAGVGEEPGPEDPDGNGDGGGSEEDADDGDGEPGQPEDQDGEETVDGGGGKWFKPKPGYYPRPSAPARVARPALSEGTKRLLYNLSAGVAGYFWGPTQTFSGWIASCGQETSISGALGLGCGICLLTAHLWDRRTRHWSTPLAWIARIPLASALTALALYAPASQV